MDVIEKTLGEYERKFGDLENQEKAFIEDLGGRIDAWKKGLLKTFSQVVIPKLHEIVCSIESKGHYCSLEKIANLDSEDGLGCVLRFHPKSPRDAELTDSSFISKNIPSITFFSPYAKNLLMVNVCGKLGYETPNDEFINIMDWSFPSCKLDEVDDSFIEKGVMAFLELTLERHYNHLKHDLETKRMLNT